MLFNSFIFFVFLGVILPLLYGFKKKHHKNSILLVSSYIFYGYWDWRFCFLLLVSTLVDFYIGRKIDSSQNNKTRKKLLILSLITNLGILGFFKYFNFFIESFSITADAFNIHLDYAHLNIILPVGISFYTFQTLSYTLDIYRRKLKATTNLLDFALFVSFFPQLVAGPIERAKHLLPQLSKTLKASSLQINDGIVLIITGLFRKVLIGDTAGRIVDPIFSDIQSYQSIELIVALFLFSIQIYADFSGYSHIARGTAKLLGIELMKNFEQPYLSRNITEFWRRWHISLSSWLKDYLYISLGGNRNGNVRTYYNLMLTMLLGGLWHGASWNFVVWGALHGIYLSIHKVMIGNKKIKLGDSPIFSIKEITKTLATFIIVLFTWLFFRAQSWTSVEQFFHKMWNWQSSEYAHIFISMAFAYGLMILILDLFENVTKSHVYINKIKSKEIKYTLLLGMFSITLLYMYQSEPAPFIYFQF